MLASGGHAMVGCTMGTECLCREGRVRKVSELLLPPAGFVEDVLAGTSDDHEGTQFVTFVLGERYGVPVRQVHEVIRVENITQIPNSPHYVEGIINHRGKILPVLNLRKRLSLPVSDITRASRIVVAEAGNKVIGLLVDSVAHVTDIPAACIENVPADVLDIDEAYITGLCRLDHGLTILLDLERLLAKEKIDLKEGGNDGEES